MRMSKVLSFFRISIYLIVASFSMQQLQASELKIRMTSNEWPPYTSAEMPQNGLVAELVRAIFNENDYPVEWRVVPWARALNMVRQTDAEGIAAWYSEERAQDFFYSDPFIQNRLTLVKRSDRNITWDTIDDLRDYTFVLLRDAVNSAEFDNADFLKKEEVGEEDLAIKMVALGRADITIRDEVMVRYVLDGQLKEFQDDIDFVEKPLAINPLYLVTSKQHPHAQEIISSFNTGLNKIIENGTYDQILAKYNASSLDIRNVVNE